jgi:hypothetical protein
MSDSPTYTIVAYGDDAYVYPTGSDQIEIVYAVAEAAGAEPTRYRGVTVAKLELAIEECSPDVAFHFLDGAQPPPDMLLDNIA